ncbi:type II secretion system F family protein [Arcanobacterium bovis]|uniref:Type II secretion system protein GspF domain-containing protein n=1 Tax=Arcanobacterium bovis TaxID=2529275 RepID=A0A4Q9V2N5_9ACTO|nr:hypothetical protein [Arcanobacterium bovis]TBW23896.1 hypothetical protein EZJ44_01870 [Arcanobacterium bovis]
MQGVMLCFLVYVFLMQVPWAGKIPKLLLKTRKTKRQHKRRKPASVDMGLLVTEVSTRLRCGSTVEYAWSRTLSHHQLMPADHGRDTTVLDADGIPVPLRDILFLSWWKKRQRKISPTVIDSLAGTFAVCRMGRATGAPMADILDACAAGITEASEAMSARKIAMAGPLTSARMLAALPVFGVLIGYVLGVNSIDFLLHTLAGNVALGLGICAEIAGIAIVRRMVKMAISSGGER